MEPAWNELKCSEAKSHEEADLCEQRRMAKAAEPAVYLNIFQIVVAIIGFTFVIWNLGYVRKGTNAAVNSANAAIRAAEAAESAQPSGDYPFMEHRSAAFIIASSR